MIAHRLRTRTPSASTFLAETGHRHSNLHAGDEGPPAQPPEPAGQSPPLAVSPRAPLAPLPPIRPLRNAERIAADRQKITDGGVLDILLDHIRGDRELSPSQLSTAFGLLKKILPDFSASSAPRDGEESRESPEDDASSVPEFEVHIVDPKET